MILLKCSLLSSNELERRRARKPIFGIQPPARQVLSGKYLAGTISLMERAGIGLPDFNPYGFLPGIQEKVCNRTKYLLVTFLLPLTSAKNVTLLQK